MSKLENCNTYPLKIHEISSNAPNGVEEVRKVSYRRQHHRQTNFFVVLGQFRRHNEIHCSSLRMPHKKQFFLTSVVEHKINEFREIIDSNFMVATAIISFRNIAIVIERCAPEIPVFGVGHLRVVVH